MTVRECAEWLLKEGYAVIANNTLVLTSKFTTQVGLNAPEVQAQIKVSNTDKKKDLWNKFCADAEIPHRVKSPTGQIYTVRQYSPSMAIKLTNIIEKVDYERLVNSTRNYYKTVSYKALLSNYLNKDIWKHEYDAWADTKSTITNDGSSFLED